MITQILHYILFGLAIIIAYEMFRAIIVGKIKSTLYKSVKDYIDTHHTRVDRFKLMHKMVVKQELLNNDAINQAIIEHAHEKNMKIRDVQSLVEEYIEEIVPFFNLLSYYKIGYWIANLLLNMIYEVVIDHENAEKLKKIPSDSVVVFVMNHRSNIDYILVAYMLAQQISLSYAVGEWARVWPLEYIFKSFGAYFIRRKYREKLYHLVLEKYVQLISLQGVTQGIFIEGGLTRNGGFRPVKIGILDYIAKIKEKKDFTRELVFVPAAINYDWVLEDRTLLKELIRKKEKSGIRENLASLARITFRGPFILFLNLVRYLTGRLKHHGYASVSFGDPVFLSDFLKTQRVDIFKLERKKRLSRIQIFADQLMDHIGKAIPVTPICITAAAVLALKEDVFSKDELVHKVASFRRILKTKGCRIVLGKAFETSRKSLRRLEEEKTSRKKELVIFEEDMLEYDEAVQTVDVALDLLKRRKILVQKEDRLYIAQKKRPFLEYYSNSLAHLLKKGTK